jgi:hypothetical protein
MRPDQSPDLLLPFITLLHEIIKRGLHLGQLLRLPGIVGVGRHGDRRRDEDGGAAERAGDFRLVPALNTQERAGRMWKQRMAAPVALASITAPGLATNRGPRGPSMVKAVSLPRWIARTIPTRARAAPRLADPRTVP